MAGAQGTPKLPMGFVVGTFVISAVVGAVVLYLGLSGHLGGPIP